MKIKLVKLSEAYKPQLFDMMDEWTSKESHFSPSAILRWDYHDFDTYLKKIELHPPTDGHVPESTYFCLDEERNVFVGAVNIRHELNDSLLQTGGHIGDGVRPSERRKGYATAMIGLALEKCKELGIERVLMTCDADNIGSKKSIMNNGGVLENTVVNDEGKDEERYWIDLKSEKHRFTNKDLLEKQLETIKLFLEKKLITKEKYDYEVQVLTSKIHVDDENE